MVVPYASEKPNLSYVRINQNTSDGTGPSIKTYITKGLVASDPFVVNASLLHPSLVAQPTVLTIVETPFWGDLELPNESQDGAKEVSKTGEAVVLENRADAVPAPPATAQPAPRTGSQEVSSMRDASNQPLTSVRLPPGAILVKMNSQQTLYPTPPPSPTAHISVATGIKRKLEEDQVNSPKVAKITTQPQKLIVVKSRPDLIQENQRLERNNKVLAEENRELREKLDLLSKILKDPRKRDMLNARLARMQTAAC